MPNKFDRLRAVLADSYPLVRKLGSGGMATVYLARDLKHDRLVAVKVMHPELASSLGTERFLREIKLTSSLSHPHILPLLDSGAADGFLYYVMPFVEGETLRQRMDRDKQLSIEETVRLVQQVAGALSYAHTLGVIHRDIKPENILLTGDQAVVADFGIAWAVSEAGGEKLTQTGLALGTPGYMSPELAGDSSDVDGRSDIYSLGCVLYELLAGQPPFTGSSRTVMARHAVDPVPSLRTVRLTVSEPLEQAVFKALAKVPADRFRTAEEFSNALTPLGTPQYGVPVVPAVTGAPARWAGSPRWGRVGQAFRSHPKLAMGLLALAAGAVIASRWIGAPRAKAWVDGRPASVVVVPFRTATSTGAEAALAGELADDITRELNRWESIRAIPSISLSGPIFDLGLAGPALERIEDGLSVARSVGAQALATVTVRLKGDSAFMETTLFDARTRRSVGRTMQASGTAATAASMVAPVVYEILGVDTTAGRAGDLRRLTAEPAALARYIEGQRRLGSWNLTDAERSFRQALALDTAFAGAMNGLAQTLYWQAGNNETQLERAGSEIARLSAGAVRHSAGLPFRDSVHIAAFYAFQLGDYAMARRRYRSLLQSDSSDVDAWLMLGTVEVLDPWLKQTASGSPTPRSDLNVATHAFAEAVRLQPTFDLGYGHLFDIYRTVAEPIDHGVCSGFKLGGGEPIPPWEDKTPEHALAFCAVALDSISWVTKATFDSLDPIRVEAGARRLFDQAIQAIRRWADFAPGLARPREELTAALLARRGRLKVAAPAVLDSLARMALQSAAEALALQRDTLPFDLLRLGSLYLGAGDLTRAMALTDAALARTGDASGVPANPLALNVLLATGQAVRALAVASHPARQVFLPDTVADSLLSFGGAEATLDRLGVLGAMGVGGAPLRADFAALRRIWSPPRYSERQALLLRRVQTLALANGLALDDAALAAWNEDVKVNHPLWQALVVSRHDSAAARLLMRRALTTETPGLGEDRQSFLLGVVAARLGAHREAAEYFARLDSIPLRLDKRDIAWGLWTLSYLRRAQAYEAIHDNQRALDGYRRFVAMWIKPDSLTRPLVDSASSAIRRLQPR